MIFCFLPEIKSFFVAARTARAMSQRTAVPPPSKGIKKAAHR